MRGNSSHFTDEICFYVVIFFFIGRLTKEVVEVVTDQSIRTSIFGYSSFTCFILHRFFLGGPLSVRGFNTRGIGPRSESRYHVSDFTK